MKPFAKYKAFLDLHHQSGPFVLPNAWDAASAKAFQNCGFKAVGTTSAGIAMSLGYPDGEHLPFETLLSVLKTITDAVDIPVSADLEAGYGQSPETVAENVKKAAAAGVVGINIEDGMKDPCRPLCDATLMEEKLRLSKTEPSCFDQCPYGCVLAQCRCSRLPASNSRPAGKSVQTSRCGLHFYPRSR